jgi:hypothetical protein
MRRNSANRYITELVGIQDYCGKDKNLLTVVKMMTDKMGSNVMPPCPLQVFSIWLQKLFDSNFYFQGRAGAYNLTVNSAFLEEFPMFIENSLQLFRMEFFTSKMETIFLMKLYMSISSRNVTRRN